jgi:hypothetical protein
MEVRSIPPKNLQITQSQRASKRKQLRPTLLIEIESSNEQTAQWCSIYDACWKMLHFRRCTGRLQSQCQLIARTALQCHGWSVKPRTRPPMGGYELQSITSCSDASLSSMVWKRHDRSWIPLRLPAYSLVTAYRPRHTAYKIDWPRCFTTPEMWDSEKESCTQHWILLTKRSWTSTSTQMLSWNPHPPRRNLMPHS